MQRGRFQNVTLHGPNEQVQCKVLIRNVPKTTVKLESGWKELCREHSLQENDKIIFEADNEHT